MLGNKKTFKAQSAMEYLMTYGWAILIIAVVLGALFSLGVFSGSSLLGTSCVASPGYLCSAPTLLTTGLLSFTFGQNTGSTIYDIQLACSATSGTGGLPTNVLAWSAIATNGLAGTSTVVGTVVGNALPGGLAWATSYGNALSLSSGQTASIVGLPCFGTTATQLATVANPVAIGQSFSGFIWLNYTTTNAAPTSSGNAWYTVKASTVTLKVV